MITRKPCLSHQSPLLTSGIMDLLFSPCYMHLSTVITGFSSLEFASCLFENNFFMHWTRCVTFEPKVVFWGTWSSLEYLWKRFLLLFWRTPLPLGVCSAIRTGRYQPPQRAVLGQVDCFIQSEVLDSQITLDDVRPRDTRTPRRSLPVVWWGSR